ncbi:MAG: tRNA lysidine(34) synthetase TilS [Paracoccaceae bacterium]|nr:MAG: tRNA lysidine(34) synthetase TilS [Paracoccaceae bacterium]
MPVGTPPADWPPEQGDDAGLLLDVAHALPPAPGRHVGVAVSGGGDSVALLHLMVRTCRHWQVPVSAVTVDHRLRAGSAAEADTVAALCASLGVPHRTMVWDHGPVAGNLMDVARRARRALIAAWAREAGVTQIALGHTADDQAESFLMALSRAAGLDGLSGMRSLWQEDGLWWGRPLLNIRRADLRAYLRRHGIGWVEDPTNADARFERVRARQTMAALAPLGIDAARIGRSAAQLAVARAALREMLRQACAAHVRELAGALRIDRAGFDALPHDLQRQLLVAGVAWLSGDRRPPRQDRQVNLLLAARDRRDATLQGCRLRSRQDCLWLAREPRAVAQAVADPDARWDGRWHLTGPAAAGLAIRALGAPGLTACPGWRATGLPRHVLEVTPAVWLDDRLVAAPLAGMPGGWRAEIRPTFAASIMAH